MVPARSRFHEDERPLGALVLKRVTQCDPEAMDVFFNHYYDRVYAHVVNLLRDPVLGQDLTQEIFLRLHRTIKQLDPERDPAGWVFTVATNVIRDHWRSREHKRGERELHVEDQSRLNAPHPDPDVQSVMEKDEELRAVWQALHSLRDADREIILLCDYEELPAARVAEMLTISPEAVRQRHSRAVTRLGGLFRKLAPNEEMES